NLTEDPLYFFVGAPTASLLFQDQVGSHAAASEVFYSFIVLGTVGVRVEMTRPLVANIFEKLHQPECRLQVGRPKAKILVKSIWHLIIQIDVKKFARFPRLRHRMH